MFLSCGRHGRAGCYNRRFRIVCLRTPFPAGMLFGKLHGFTVSLTPYLTAHFVKGFHCPFDDMEGIDTPFAVRGKFIHAFRDSFCPVTGNHPDG